MHRNSTQWAVLGDVRSSRVGNLTGMDPLEKAVQAYKRAQAKEKAARDVLYEEIRRARNSGVSQVEVVRRTGYTREYIRRIERSFEGGS